MIVQRPWQMRRRSWVTLGDRRTQRDQSEWFRISDAHRIADSLRIKRKKLPGRRIVGCAEPTGLFSRPDVAHHRNDTSGIIEGDVAPLRNPSPVHQKRRCVLTIQRDDLIEPNRRAGIGISYFSTEMCDAIK